MISKKPDDTRAPDQALAEALKKNEQAATAVEEVAEELGVVHAVLVTQISKIAAEDDLASAADRTGELQSKLEETAEKMDEVNRALADQRASLAHLSKAT